MTVTPLVPPQRPRTAWVLGGGGNLGSIQVGMLRALVARGERPDAVLGCSVGSLNALGVAADPTVDGIETLRRVWLELSADDVFPTTRTTGPWSLFRRSLGMYPNDGLRRLVERCAPHPNLEDYSIPVQCVATELSSGRPHWFERGSVVDAVLASAALPGALPPVTVDGTTYIDGGVTDNVPMLRAVDLGFDRVVVLHVGNFNRPRPIPKRPIDVLVQSFSIARNARFEIDLLRMPTHVDLIVLPGIDPGGVKRSDFSRSATLIDRATAATSAFLDLRAARASTG